MTRAELKSAAKNQIRGKIGLCFIMYLIVFAISSVCSWIPIVVFITSLIISPAFTLSFCIFYLTLSAVFIINFIISSAFFLSLFIFYLKLTKGEDTSVRDVFAGFNKTGRALWLNTLITVFKLLWSCLFIIPGIIKSYAYSMAYYVLADNPELTASEALAKSQSMMYGHKMELFILDLSFIGWFILTGLTFGLAAIYVVPYMSVTMANFYNSIKES